MTNVRSQQKLAGYPEQDVLEQSDETVRLPPLLKAQLRHWYASRAGHSSNELEDIALGGPSVEHGEALTPSSPEKIEGPTSTPVRPDWQWPTVILLSALAAGLVTFVFKDVAIRPLIVFWFLFVCPGMVLVRFLRLKEPIVEWTLAVGLSFTVDAIVAGIQLYAGKWSPSVTFGILLGVSVAGAVAQLLMGIPAIKSKVYALFRRVRGLAHIRIRLPSGISLRDITFTSWFSGTWASSRGIKRPALRLLIAFALLATLLSSIVTGAASWLRQEGGQSTHSTSSSGSPAPAPPRPRTVAGSEPVVTATSLPTPSHTPVFRERYSGILFDIPESLTIHIPLVSIQRHQGTVSGYLNLAGNTLGGKIPRSGPFQGTVNTSGEVRFILKDSTDQATFSFTGRILADQSMQGEYCSLSAGTPSCSDYGVWSIFPSS